MHHEQYFDLIPRQISQAVLSVGRMNLQNLAKTAGRVLKLKVFDVGVTATILLLAAVL